MLLNVTPTRSTSELERLERPKLPARASDVVLLHDWLTGFRGGEWILDALAEMHPESALYTLLHVPGSTSLTIENREIVTSPLQDIPGIARHYRKFLPLMPWAAEQLKVPAHTRLMLSSSHCVIKGVPKPKGAAHVSYVHSPMRYMYDQFDTYFGPTSHASWLQRQAARAMRPYLTKWDRESNRGVDVLIANSQFVRERIRREYERDAEVVHPFVELKDFPVANVRAMTDRGDYHVMVTAFAPNKRVDLAIEAFNELGWPLRIVGAGQDERRLRAMAGPTIEFMGPQPRSEVVRLMSYAKGFVFPGVEDFGITPLESLAAGTPVLAFKAGGVLETLRSEDTEFFEEPKSASLVAAARRAEERWKAGEFKIDRSRLEAFSRARFQAEIRDIVADTLS